MNKMLSLKQFGAHFTKNAKSAHASAKSLSERIQISTAPRLSIKEQAFFIKRLSFLVRANVPILESLHMIEEQVKARSYSRILKKVIVDVSNGQSLAKAFSKFPNIFGVFAINIIKVGESSGILSQNLDYLAEELKKRHLLSRKIISAFVYPAVIAVATLAITGFLMLYLFPKITPVFTSLNMELPLSTKIVMAGSTFLQSYGIWLIGALAVFGVVMSFLVARVKAVHYTFDQILISTPVVGTVVQYYNLANSTRTLGLLLKSGLTLSEAIPLTADTTKNLVYRSEWRELSKTVNRGEQLSVFFKKHSRYFPAVMSQMVGVGERSGNLSPTLLYLSEMYEAEVDDFTKNLSSLVEPALMIIMGVLVGFIAISIITPIYGITQNLTR